MILKILLSFIILIQIINCNEICYYEEGLGCFTDYKSSYQGIFSIALPENPKKISTKFLLYNNQENTNNSTVVVVNTINDLDNFNQNFDPSLETKFIIHGFHDKQLKQWVIDMKNAILRVEDCNVIIVDWTNGNRAPYSQAAANAQVIGAQTAKIINSTINMLNYKPSKIHLIGYSLGAHVAGYIGSHVSGIGNCFLT
jgi:pancreatic triacylglycerol lipase